MADLETLQALINGGSIDTVIVAFPDLQGRPVGKRVTGDFFLRHVAEHGIEVCEYLLAVDVDMTPLPGYRQSNWDTGYGDLGCVPDYSTTRVLPWQPGTAMVLADLVDASGMPVEVSPRQILRRQIERAAARGFTVRCATELEFYLFRQSFDEAAARGWRGLEPHSGTIEDYQLLQTTREEYVLRRVRNEMLRAGIPIEFSKGEAGRGQHEVNVTYAEALETADRHLVFKNGVKEIAGQEGRAATFMAKWSMEDAGSSCHVHASLWDAGTDAPVMAPAGGGGNGGGSGGSQRGSAGGSTGGSTRNTAAAGTDDLATSGLSVVGRQFVAGQLGAARQLTWCFAPYVNSYRRFVPDSWAPTAVVWGEDNRTCGFRLVGHGPSRRVENRIPGADVNPYLALAATIAAGLYGIDHQLELEPAYTANAYTASDVPRIASSLAEAIGDFERSEVAAEGFGEAVHQHLVNTARQEWATANRAVTDWELARNFERI